jgi:Xaa-Pro aminopeptidase
VRIEDDIVCTDKGPFNLTEKAPKTIEEVEASIV